MKEHLINRTIKFRVWNHGINQMYDVYGFNDRQIQWRNESGGLGGSFSYGKNNKKKFTLLQYLGSTDKNGKDIFEGDVVKCVSFEDEKDEVVWIADIRMIPSEMTGSNIDSVEVIGNIFENPELLPI